MNPSPHVMKEWFWEKEFCLAILWSNTTMVIIGISVGLRMVFNVIHLFPNLFMNAWLVVWYSMEAWWITGMGTPGTTDTPPIYVWLVMFKMLKIEESLIPTTLPSNFIRIILLGCSMYKPHTRDSWKWQYLRVSTRIWSYWARVFEMHVTWASVSITGLKQITRTKVANPFPTSKVGFGNNFVKEPE